MPEKTYEFLAYVTVHKEQELLDAACENAVKTCGDTLASALERLAPDGKIDCAVCIQQLLDPGISPPGLSILESECD